MKTASIIGPGEIMVTTGVAQGMFASLMAFLDPGDEVLVPDPVYLSYADIPKIAQAKVKRYKLLEENDYQIDIEEVESLITDRTKMMVIVSPSNPTGGVLTRDNLEEVSRLAAKHDLLVLSDEIYEKLVYDESRPHISIASFPGMKERTLLLNGLSKSMAMTGWRVGYIAAPAELLEPINRLCFYMTDGSTSFVQYAAAIALRHQDGSVEKMRREFRRRRDYLVKGNQFHEAFQLRSTKGSLLCIYEHQKVRHGFVGILRICARKIRPCAGTRGSFRRERPWICQDVICCLHGYS